MTDKNGTSARYPTFFNGETISGTVDIKLNSNNFIPQKPQGFRDIYINQSPTFFNQYRYDIEGNISFIVYVFPEPVSP